MFLQRRNSTSDWKQNNRNENGKTETNNNYLARSASKKKSNFQALEFKNKCGILVVAKCEKKNGFRGAKELFRIINLDYNWAVLGLLEWILPYKAALIFGADLSYVEHIWFFITPCQFVMVCWHQCSLQGEWSK